VKDARRRLMYIQRYMLSSHIAGVKNINKFELKSDKPVIKGYSVEVSNNPIYIQVFIGTIRKNLEWPDSFLFKLYGLE
jgi:hypothetical protein